MTVAPVVVFNPAAGDQTYVLAPLAVRVVLVPLQMLADAGVRVKVGKGFTVIVLVAVFEQPPALVPVTVYVVFAVGLTVMLVVVAPVFQLYETPPDAVSVAPEPLHIVAKGLALIVMVGNEPEVTVTVTVFFCLQLPASVPVTV